uniref:WRKY transcription factor n=1 Tax=Zea mays TaxID=4577 RepID=B4FT49_MAIZE
MAPPPPPYARVMEDMVKGREYATQLKALLRESPEASRLVDRILHAISLTIQTASRAWRTWGTTTRSIWKTLCSAPSPAACMLLSTDGRTTTGRPAVCWRRVGDGR